MIYLINLWFKCIKCREKSKKTLESKVEKRQSKTYSQPEPKQNENFGEGWQEYLRYD